METISAKISSADWGECNISVSGDGKISRISCSDKFAEAIVRDSIHNGKGCLANGYHPLPDTMLQAYATILKYADRDDVEVEGDIGEIPFEQGVIY